MKRDPGPLSQIDPFYYDILNAIEEECQRLSLNMLYTSISVDHYGCAQTWPDTLDDNSVDGLLLVGLFIKRDIVPIPDEWAAKPIVLIDAYASGYDLDNVVIDNTDGAFKAVSYLIKQGHERIAVVGGCSKPVASHPAAPQRRQGYMSAVQAHNLPCYLTESDIEKYNLWTFEAGYYTAQQLLIDSPEVTAVFACNDVLGSGVIKAARDLGRHVPEDLSVVGFDDIAHARLTHPPLTTMKVDRALMGALAVRHLSNHQERLNKISVTTMLSTEIIVRESVSFPAHR